MTEIKHKIPTILFYIFIFYSLLLILLPINPIFPKPGADPSWQWVIDYAFSKNFKFGEEIVFTYGPLGSFHFPGYYYNPNTYAIAIAVSLLLAITIFASFYLLSDDKKFGIFVVLITMGGFFWYLLPILLVTIYVKKQNLVSKNILLFLLIFFLSFSVLVKFSHFPVAFITVFLIDALQAYKNKKFLPLFTISFFTIIICLFLISGQELGSFFSYFLGSLHTLSGYSESMQLTGRVWKVYVFLGFCILSLWFVLKAIQTNKLTLEDSLLVIVTVLVLFMGFKNGFVRHDAHDIQAFAAIAMVSGIYYTYFNVKEKLFKSLLIVITLAYIINNKNLYPEGLKCSLIYSLHEKQYTSENFKKILSKKNLEKIEDYFIKKCNFEETDIVTKKYHSRELLFENIVYIPIKNFFAVFNILSTEYKEKLDKEYYSSINAVKEQCVLNDINGSVDIYPWDQAYLLANRLEYKPRPLFQSYSVYTDYLINNNIEHLYSKKAADNILFRIEEMDGRVPATMEGASWLHLIKLYDVADKIICQTGEEFLVLTKTKRNKDFNFNFISSKTINFNDSVELPKFDNLYLEIEVKKSSIGKLINVFFKSSLILIEFTFDNNEKKIFRLVPGSAKAGFVVSPWIDSIEKFNDFASGTHVDKKVKSFKVINNSIDYNSKINIYINQINIIK